MARLGEHRRPVDRLQRDLIEFERAVLFDGVGRMRVEVGAQPGRGTWAIDSPGISVFPLGKCHDAGLMECNGGRPDLAGLHHLGVSVTDLERSLRFYRDVVGADVLIEDATSVASPSFVGRAAILSLGGLVFDLYEHSRNGGERFDPARTGLDHLALEARSPEELQVWAAWVDGCGIERSEIRDVAGGLGRMFDFVDPDGLQIEFIHLTLG